MAAYSYKEVCHRPELGPYVESFEKNYQREFDDDANYDGDYWLVTSDYIDDLVKERDELIRLLREVNKRAPRKPLNLTKDVDAILSRYQGQP